MYGTCAITCTTIYDEIDPFICYIKSLSFIYDRITINLSMKVYTVTYIHVYLNLVWF